MNSVALASVCSWETEVAGRGLSEVPVVVGIVERVLQALLI